jgi:hypothetical protein
MLMNIVAAAACLLLAAQEGKPFPPLPPVADGPSYGAGVQRTMTLLATSTPQKKNKVRILFYGQSITEQDWWKQVSEDLKRRFPNADLEIENRAVGGFASQILVRVAEHDIPSFYPDLVIFHVYGAHDKYEEILKLIRTRTTSEILMQTDHAEKWPVANPEQKDPGWWPHMMNDIFLPDFAKKYGCGLADVRSAWVTYLKTNKLEPKALLRDDVHLNDHGCYVMAEIVKRYLVYKPALMTDATKSSVRIYEVGKDLKMEGGALKLEFEGNRVDVLSAPGKGGTARVLIDGKKPSEIPELIAFTRTGPSQSWWGPALLRVSSEKPRLLEDWTLKVSAVDEKAEHIRFSVTGSKTGPDGEGESAEKFVSNSGRVVIETGDWWVKNVQDFTKKPVPVGFEVKWKAVLQGADIYSAPATEDSTKESSVMVAQGLSNGRHTLELKGPAQPLAIRIYRPPLK